MKTNTVILTIEEYNELRDFKKEVMNSEVVTSYYSSYNGLTISLLTKNEMIETLMKDNALLQKEITRLERKVDVLKLKTRQDFIKDIKKLSIFKLLKLKYKRNN